MKPIKLVLIPTDLSDPSKLAIDAGAEFAKKFGAEVVLAYVAEDRIPPLGMIEVSGFDLVALEKRHRETARKNLAKVAAKLEQEGLKVQLDVGLGVPHAEIVKMAEKHGADLLVMGTHGRGFISHAILGSTTERVLRHAPCPVLAVRDPRAQALADRKESA